MAPFVNLISNIIDLFNIVLIAYIILSWLISFNIINRYQPFVAKVYDVLTRLTEPVLKPIRKFMPDLGGIDISPIVLVLLLNFIDSAMKSYLLPISAR